MIVLTVLPFAGLIAAVTLLWNKAVGPSDLALFAGMYVLCGFGITIGFHRMLTHHAFEAIAPLKAGLLIFGSLAIQGPAIDWAVDHRTHHAFSDKEGDPHSPHVDHGHGWSGALRGLAHAHVGWMFGHNRTERERYAKDLLGDRLVVAISNLFPLWVLLSFAIPFALGGIITSSWKGAVTGLVWGGLVRLFFNHHITWSVNSICHFLGTRRFDVDDESRNVFWLALPSLGESWHHNHHAFPRSAVAGLRRWELDPSALVITAMERLGLAWNVVRIAPERQAARASGSRSGAVSRAPVS